MKTFARYLAIITSLSFASSFAEAQTCPSANSLWTATLSGGGMSSPISADGTFGFNRSYVASGSSVVALNNTNGGQAWTTPLNNSVISFPLAGPLSSGIEAVLFGGLDGFAHARNAQNGAVLWDADLRRPACLAGDQISASTGVLIRQYANAEFQAAVPDDLVIVPTRHGCGSTTTNRIYALRASNGAVFWTFNGAGGDSIDYFAGGCGFDYSTNTVFCTAHTAANQNTVFALNAIDGSLRWARPYGSIHTLPTLAVGGRIYVTTFSGILRAIDATNGNEIWNVNVGTSITYAPRAEFRSPYNGYIFVTGSNGRLYIYRDLGLSAQLVHPAIALPGANITTLPVLLPNVNLLYVGMSDGTIRQVNLLTNPPSENAKATVGTTQVGDVIIDADPTLTNLKLAGSIATRERFYCIPWAPGSNGTM